MMFWEVQDGEKENSDHWQPEYGYGHTDGAFLTGLSEGMAVKDAIRMANLASSIAVTRKGAQSSLPERTEVDTILT
ncbi:MAG: PfkB family carbohydrate kinase [Oliverpabstia sp.]